MEKEYKYGHKMLQIHKIWEEIIRTDFKREIKIVKDILSENEKLELETEESIRNGKIKTKKTVLEEANVREQSRSSHEQEDGPPQCTQQ